MNFLLSRHVVIAHLLICTVFFMVLDLRLRIFGCRETADFFCGYIIPVFGHYEHGRGSGIYDQGFSL